MSAVLWQISISHYSEKARWALDRKGIDYSQRAPTPGAHMAVALWLTRGECKTFPVLQLDGRAIGGSNAIVAALDEHRPEPRLIPDDPAERARALEIERFFDEEFGPYIRLFAFHEVRADPAASAAVAERVLPAPLVRTERGRAVGARIAGAFVALRYRADSDERAAAAREKVIAGLDRLDREVESAGGPYLVGESFSVADLTAAALVMPFVQPPEGPAQLRLTASLRRFQDEIRDRPGFRWVAETYARERRPPA